MPNYSREKGSRFVSRGLRTGSPADTLSEGEYPLLANVRGNTRDEVTTRAGHIAIDSGATGVPIRNLSSYITIDSGAGAAKPVYVAASGGNVYIQGTLAPVDTGYGTGIPSMLPLRPSAAADAWMYVSDATQYHKVSPRNPVTPAIVTQKVGITEPLAPPSLYLEEANTNFVRFNATRTEEHTSELQ